MTKKKENLPLAAKGSLECGLSARELLTSAYFNKGSAFTAAERRTFGLHGLLPACVQTLDDQVVRAYGQYSSHAGGKGEGMARNTFLASLKDQNYVLYYKLIETHIEEMFSIIYTPTEGEAIEQYSEIFRRPDGCFLDIHEPDGIDPALAEWGSADDVDYIVVTDGEEILGIGDQGVGGILISTAKLALMTLCGGIHPNRVLPVVIDCGTDNKKLLEDDLYLGLRHGRVRGQEYDDFIDKFVHAVKTRFPRAVLHFEDFGLGNARRLLERYRDDLPVFNDDVQGTGVVALAAINAAAWVSELDLKDLRMVVFGAGSAGAGIADQFRDALVESGKSRDEANKQVWLVDKPGLLLGSHDTLLTSAQRPYARLDAEWTGTDTKSLTSIIAAVKPHVLIGCSTLHGAFSEPAVREMSKHVARPIIFPLSNPTRLHEADPKDLYTWTDGKVLMATGSPFPPVHGYEVAECNNATAFPGIGLGAVLSRATKISDKMLVAAVKALAGLSPALSQNDPKKGLLPGIKDVRFVSKKIACEVIRAAVEEGLATVDVPRAEEELDEWVGAQMWEATYRPLKKVEGKRESKGNGHYVDRGTAV